jgi:hypothetical protein
MHLHIHTCVGILIKMSLFIKLYANFVTLCGAANYMSGTIINQFQSSINTEYTY